MKAWVLHGIGDLRPEEVEKPVPAKGEVLIRVKAAGICGSDIPRICQNGAWSHPLIPGHEFSGVGAEVGEAADASWLGRRAGIYPLIPCGSCMTCRRGYYEMCRNYSYIGSRRDGAFAEYVTVPTGNLLPLPDRIAFEEAAMLEPLAVAVHAMRRGGLSAEDTAVICGAGTVGLLLAMVLLETGVRRLLVIGRKEAQRQAVRKLGLPADSYCDSGREDAAGWILDHTDGRGGDLFFECVGRNETYALAIQSTAPFGKVVLVGNPFTDMGLSREVYWKILRNQLTVTGSWNSSFLREAEDDWNYALKRLAEKRVRPAELITHRLSLGELGRGVEIMRDRTEDYIKVMGIFE